MLINFCNPNQLLAAINIKGSIITFFYYHCSEHEAVAFAGYIKDAFEIQNAPGHEFSINAALHHEARHHQETSHLARLRHQHLYFGKPITPGLGKELIDAIKKYQNKNSTAMREYYETEYFSTVEFTWLERFYAVIDFIKYFNQPATLHLPLLSTKNIKRLTTEFAKIPTQTFHSTPLIINFLNTGITSHNLSLRSSQPYSQRLIAGTCRELNDIVAAENQTVDRIDTALSIPVYALSFYLSLWALRKINAWGREQAEQQPLRLTH